MLEIIELQFVIQVDWFVLCFLQRFDVGLIGFYVVDDCVVCGMWFILNLLLFGMIEVFIDCVFDFEWIEDVWVIDGMFGGILFEVVGIVSMEKMDCGQSEVFFWVVFVYWNIGIVIVVVQVLIVVNLYNVKILFVEVFQESLGLVCVLINFGFIYFGDVEVYLVVCDCMVLIWIYICKVD